LEETRAFRRSAAVSVTASGPRSPRTGVIVSPCGY